MRSNLNSKIMKRLKKLALLSFLLTLVGCDYFHTFSFTNNSTRDVYIYVGVIDRKLGGTLYPDTAISRDRIGIPVKQGATRDYEYHNGKEDIWSNNTFCLFVFDADTFNMYDWEEIKDGYKILQRYDISYENLTTLKRKISYPPDERMKNIKMYPPYEE